MAKKVYSPYFELVPEDINKKIQRIFITDTVDDNHELLIDTLHMFYNGFMKDFIEDFTSCINTAWYNDVDIIFYNKLYEYNTKINPDMKNIDEVQQVITDEYRITCVENPEDIKETAIISLHFDRLPSYIDIIDELTILKKFSMRDRTTGKCRINLVDIVNDEGGFEYNFNFYG